jgi:hypothetical protein
VKKTVTEVVPEDVIRAKASAWLTLISPLTQWAGLKGDQLAHKREVLRIQQEEALYLIAQSARKKLEVGELASHPVPNKFLIPFLEKASLEEADSDLIDLWASLLASAAHDYNPHYIHFANLISQMSAQQAEIFTQVTGTKDAKSLELTLDGLMTSFTTTFMQDYVAQWYAKEKSPPADPGAMWDLLEQHLNMPGVDIKHIELEERVKTLGDEDHHSSGQIEVSIYKDNLETDFAILDATRLLRYEDTGFFVVGDRWHLKIMFHYVTRLGQGFASACGIVK